MKRIVVVRAGALGDVILTIPALRVLRGSYPDAHLTVVGYPDLWAPARDLVDEVESIDHPRFAGLFHGKTSALSGWLEDIDLLVAWTTRAPNMDLFSIVPTVVHASPYPPPGIHAAEWLVQSLDPVRRAAMTFEEARAVSGRDGLRRARSWGATDTPAAPQGPIFIHPGAGAAWKRWPAERFASLGDQLRGQNREVVLIEGPADAQAVEAVKAASRTGFPVLSSLTLTDLAEQLRTGALFVGNDSGVTHLAAFLGVPTIALFGPTDPISWAPMGSFTILRGCETRTTVQGQIRVCDDPRCMERMPLEEVVRASGALLGGAVENRVDNPSMEG